MGGTGGREVCQQSHFRRKRKRLEQATENFDGRRKARVVALRISRKKEGWDRHQHENLDGSINCLTEKETAGAGADNQIFDVKGNGWGRRPKILTDGRRKARAIVSKISREKEGWDRHQRENFDGRRKDGADAMP